MKKIYLDYNATTPVAPSVVDSMQPFFTEHFGNPSSGYSLGRAAAEAIEDGRSKVASLLGCDLEEIIFTSGGTEANHLAICGTLFRVGPAAAGHMVISSIEHPAVTEPARFLERLGYGLTVVECDSNGYVHPSTVEAALQDDTRLVSIMHANNEVGTVQPIRQIAEICHGRDILVHTDASQSAGKIHSMVDELGVDMLTIAGHKLYGPKGVGALYVRSGVALEPFLRGGGQERGLRAGTENTPLIVGLGQAAYLSFNCLSETIPRLTELRDKLQNKLTDGIPGLVVHAEKVERLPNTLSVSFPGTSGQEMLRRVPEMCASTGSACHSGSEMQSVTLTAMRVDLEIIRGTVRLSLGWNTSEEDLDRAANLLLDAWEMLTTQSA
ncbi:MAG: cysteine desulfurase [Planctomycetaceae bacterium]|nr:cysteine desulfurase [Planctomycetaceae bacterium]